MKALGWVLAGVLLAAGVAWNCGPFLPMAVFVYARHPDVPRTPFVEGELGILRPTYAQSYLVVAYRYLSGVGLTAREREGVRDYWRDRATGQWDHDQTDWQARWEALVQPGSTPEPAVEEPLLAYQPRLHAWVINCAEDAFRTAVQTYEARSRQFGANDAGVRSWLAAQQAVFANCAMEKRVLPAPAEPGLPEILKQDRAYQVAAAHFYAGDAQEAIAGFQAIAADTASPWSTISAYLVVRARLRAAESDEDLAAVRDAGLKVLADVKRLPVHGMTRTLLRRADVAAGRAEAFHQMALALSGPNEDGSIREDLWDYTTMFDTLSQSPELRADELTDWVRTFQSGQPDAARHARERWQAAHGLVWLVAVLDKAAPGDPGLDEVLGAARAVDAKSPAYLTVTYHRLRLALARGDKARSRTELDVLLRGPLPASARNLFQPLRMLAAPALGDFLRFVPRTPVLVTDNFDETESFFNKEQPGRPLFDPDGAAAFNEGLPLRLWTKALRQPVPGALKKRMATALIARAAVTGAWTELTAALPVVEQIRPDLKPWLGGLRDAKSDEERRFAAAFLLLHAPEARPYLRAGAERMSRDRRIDDYRDNWWCPETRDYGHSNYEIRNGSETPAGAWKAPAFLSAAELRQAAEERARVRAAGSALQALGSAAVAWAKAHKEDPRAPEALALTVKLARYGCAGPDDWKVTRSAFQALHLSYPGSEWAKRTPVWVRD